MESSNKYPSINRVLVTSFIVDITDVLLNVAVAVLSGSVVMLSQALQGGSDLIASGLLIIGLKRSRRPSDKNYPFGYGKELYFWTMMAALVMLEITATLSFYLGYKRFIDPQPVHNIYLAYAVLIFGLITNSYAAYLSSRRLLGKRSPKAIFSVFSRSVLIETKTALVLDIMGSGASILGLLALFVFQATGDFRFDGLGAMSIGVMLALLSAILLDGIKDMLVGRKASDEVERSISEAALNTEHVKNVMDLKTMHIGASSLLINIEVHVDSKLKTSEIEHVTDRIKKNISDAVPSAKHIQVEIETI